MTLVAHILHNDFQFIALDGKVQFDINKRQYFQENFKKNIRYKNGLIFMLNEYNKGDI